MKLATLTLVIAFCMFNPTYTFECRDGIENSVAIVYTSRSPCEAGQTACFQSLRCSSIGHAKYKDFKWSCIDRKKCKNESATLSYAYYEDVRGICCFTSNCNAYRLKKCTASGFSTTPLSKFTYLGLAVAVFLFATNYK